MVFLQLFTKWFMQTKSYQGEKMEKMFDTAIVGALSFLLFILSIGFCVAGGGAPIDAFPPAAEGQVRHVLNLEDKVRGKEDNFQVELIPGKVVMTDGVNVSRVALSLEPVNLKGWGYTYYKVSGNDHVLTTMMAVPEGTPAVEDFVAGKSLMVRYNSRLPLVIYSPEGIEIRYRIWTAGEVMEVLAMVKEE